MNNLQSTQIKTKSDHQVQVRITGTDRNSLIFHKVINQLDRELNLSTVGTFDDVSFSGKDEVLLTFYGANALRIHRVIDPIFKAYPSLDLSSVLLRFGPPGEHTLKVEMI